MEKVVELEFECGRSGRSQKEEEKKKEKNGETTDQKIGIKNIFWLIGHIRSEKT